MPVISPDDLRALIEAALVASNTSEANAASTAAALALAEIDGRKGHGLSRVPSYAAQAESGKVDGHAVPVADRPRPGILAIDAGHGFAYPAFDLLQKELPGTARANGVALAAIRRSHHYGVAGHHVERLAEEGLVALLFGNTPAAIAPWGGRTPTFGTNPVAFAAPVAGRPPLVVDLATSKVARGYILAARQKGEKIPEGWALDAKGKPTTDPVAALKGSMVPMADAKGAALALMIEALAGAMAGAAFGHEASSFFEADGPPPNTGQVMIAIDPSGLAGDMAERLAGLAGLVEKDGGRMPGAARQERRAKAGAGLEVDAKALADAEAVATGGGG